MPAAPLGNQYAVRLKDPAIRQEAYRQYCKHIGEGWPKEAFFFDHASQSASWQTLERYIKTCPDEFDIILMQQAKAMRLKYWIEEGKKIQDGRYTKSSPIVWQTMMRNMFRDIGWDQDKVLEALDDQREQFRDFMQLLKLKQVELQGMQANIVVAS